jgi:hypothetical protein
MKHDIDCNHVALSMPDDCNQCGVVEKVRLRERNRIVNLIESLDNRVTMVQKGWLLDTIVEMIHAQHN